MCDISRHYTSALSLRDCVESDFPQRCPYCVGSDSIKYFTGLDVNPGEHFKLLMKCPAAFLTVEMNAN